MPMKILGIAEKREENKDIEGLRRPITGDIYRAEI